MDADHFVKLDPDPHQSEKQDPNPDPYQSKNSGPVEAQNGAMECRRGSTWSSVLSVDQWSQICATLALLRIPDLDRIYAESRIHIHIKVTSRISHPDSHQSEKWDPDPQRHQELFNF